MLTGKVIRGFMLNNVQRGTKFHAHDIQAMIRNNFGLSKKDLEPHTLTRPTTYARYKHRIQGVLSDLKKQGKVIHYPNSQEYLFL